jgi:hypothetical protein
MRTVIRITAGAALFAFDMCAGPSVALAQPQPGPNLGPGGRGMYTYSPRAGYLGPPTPIVLPPLQVRTPWVAERVGQATHNGSVMNVITWQDAGSQMHIRIEYLQPRPALAAIGVRPGTVLLTGQWINRELVATAAVFPPGCPAIPYAVMPSVAWSMHLRR